MKKIAYLLGSLNRGGTETLMLDVFRNAEVNNLDAIGIYRKTGICEQDFCNSGIPLFKLTPTKNILHYLLKLRRLIVRNDVQVVHAQQPFDALLAYFALFGTGIKILLTLHGFDYNEQKKGKIIHQFILNRTDSNVYVSTYQKEYYINKYRLNTAKQFTVFNGISFRKFKNTNQNFLLKEELNVSPQTILLTAVGNFNTVRDQLTLCRFAKLLRDENVDFKLLLVGKRIDSLKSLYDDCTNFCAENNLSNHVLFLGVRQDIPELLIQSDVFLYSTNHDTFGIAVVEALACGLPVFVNDWPVMSEITENGKLATLYKTKDETDLFRQFSLYLQDKKQFQDKANLASKTVLNKYNIEKHIQNLKKIYLLSNH